VAGVDQADFQAGILQDRAGAEPVVAGAFHGDGFDGALHQPVAQGVEAGGEGAEGAHMRGVAAAVRDGDDEFLRAHVDAASVGMVGDVQRGVGGGEFFAPMVFALALAHELWWGRSAHDGAAAEHNESVS